MSHHYFKKPQETSAGFGGWLEMGKKEKREFKVLIIIISHISNIWLGLGI
jgi:hypothetical protein